MQCIIKEKLQKQALGLSAISKIYYSDKSKFILTYMRWLDASEKELTFYKSPVGMLFQAEKSKILSVLDGYLPEQVPIEKNLRKVQRAVTAQSLNYVSQEIYNKLQSIDADFAAINEKLSHATAILGTKYPDLFASLENNENSVNKIWRLLRECPETLPMYNYFCAKLASIDIKYLISGIVAHITGNMQTLKNVV